MSETNYCSEYDSHWVPHICGLVPFGRLLINLFTVYTRILQILIFYEKKKSSKTSVIYLFIYCRG